MESRNSPIMASIRDLWRALREGAKDTTGARRDSASDAFGELQRQCANLEERLHWCDQQLRQRTELLYELQRQYSTEHFNLYESMRNLKTERLRNAGAYESLDNILTRAKQLQERIAHLKARLQQYESVDDIYFDTEPIFIEDPEQ
jgi:chromosome segregation ATPase